MKMIDALYPDGIPAGTTCDAIAAYIDHDANPDSFAQAQARFPDALHAKISARAPGTVGADVLDVEPGTYITPQHAVAWAVKSRAAGIDPTVYCNQMDPSWGWPAVRAAFAAANVPEPHWWVANYDRDPTIPVGALGKQYTDLDPAGRNTYDTSNMIAIPGHLYEEDADLDATQNQRLIDIQAKVDQDHYAITHSILPALARLDAARLATTATVEAAVKQAMPSATDADAQTIAAAVLAALGAALAPQGTAGTDTAKGAQ